MKQSSTLDIGLDVHKESIAVAYVAKAHDADVLYLGTIGTRHVDIDSLVRKLQSKAARLVFVYEAGRCGYWLYPDLTQKGHCCWLVAPSLIPKIVFQEYVRAVGEHTERLQRLEQELKDQVPILALTTCR